MYISSVSDVTCPRCQAPASKGRGKPYCSKCGWNLVAAENGARERLKQIPLTLLLFAGFFAFILLVVRNSTVGVVVIGLFLGIFLIYDGLADWMLLRKVSELREVLSGASYAATPQSAAISSGQKISEAEFATWDRTVRRDHEPLLSLAVPRDVRSSSKGKIGVAAILGACVVALGGFGVSSLELARSSVNSTTVLPTLLWLAMLLLFVCIGVIETRNELRRRRIIMEGEATLAKVVGQVTTGGKSRGSKISYVFRDRAGKFYEGSDYDRRRELYEEMPVVVFYDPANPSDSVAECANYWDIVAPPARIC
jgi:hypothetical protein